ncbi:type II toxin-antitoxin system CcdA family antitoxin [Nitrospirillum iridis]|uniref:Post-segregation antitoxin (Ccd killing protein) n=1 Tax=Nitrospirillum iridis TaxID=765888 RepID=A0A7X0AY86_9PROT|nr:type II toxin-antitoxin system CcdA family antitoxin [Nitrospirillum iridis]MBB6251957.1 post-segregation antitoxin (ccd killing protein) [Nitrospirillum iridis]
MSEEQAARGQAENQAAIAEWNEFIEKHGLPLAKYRSF